MMGGPHASKSFEVYENYIFPSSPQTYWMGRGFRIWVHAVLIYNSGFVINRI